VREDVATDADLAEELQQEFLGFHQHAYDRELAVHKNLNKTIFQLLKEILGIQKQVTLAEDKLVPSNSRRAKSVSGRSSTYAHGDNGCFICASKPHKRCHTWPGNSENNKVIHRIEICTV
ncbi:hypothetical protein L9F63_000724, partial [Diploptera punctata]